MTVEKKLQELVNRRPNKWGNVSIKEFERDIKMLQDAVKERAHATNIERDYAFLYLRENIVRLETRLKHDHLLPEMVEALEKELSILQADLILLEKSAERSA